jgi:hypothetical protein
MPQAATPQKYSFGAFLSSYFSIFNPLPNSNQPAYVCMKEEEKQEGMEGRYSY